MSDGSKEAPRWTAGRRRVGWPAVALVALLGLAGCGGLGSSVPPTATPYPRRSPVVGSPVGMLPTAAGGGSGVVVAAARAAIANGEAEGARRLIDEALAEDGASADLLAVRAAASTVLGDSAAAEADWGGAIAREPGNPVHYLGRARARSAAADGRGQAYAAALDDVGRARAVAPDSVAARLTRARILLDRLRFRGDREDANRAIAELDAIAPGQGGEGAALLRAEALAEQGDPAGAAAVLAAPTLRSTAAPPVAAVDRPLAEARVAMAGRDWDGARTASEAAAGIEPMSPVVLRVVAESALAGGDAAAALEAAERLLEVRPEDGVGWFLRGAALTSLGREEDAIAALRGAAERLPESPVYQARIAQRLRGVGQDGELATPRSAELGVERDRTMPAWSVVKGGRSDVVVRQASSDAP